MTAPSPDATPFTAPPVPHDAQLWLLRHGETQWSLDGRHTGVTDIPLTDDGRAQAAALRPSFEQVFADQPPALVLSSPRQRCLVTAELAGLHVDETTGDLAEWDYGDYEGRSSADIHTENPGWTIFADDAPGGETADDVARRADRVLTRAAHALADGPVVLVGHGHMSRVLGARWIGMSARAGARLTLGTAARCVLGAEHEQAVIVRWNITDPVA